MDAKKTPSVSIVLPTYNRASLVGRAIASVIAQTFADWELIVLDGASTDNTAKVLEEWRARDARIRVVREEKNYHPDISRSLNAGIAAARGKYIARLDDDDYWIDEDKLKKQFAFLESHPDYAVVGSGMVVVDQHEKEIYRFLKRETDEEIRRTALSANPFAHTTVMFRADIAGEVGGYGNWRYAEDWDLWLKMGTRGKLYNFPEYMAAYTFAGQNKSFLHLRAQSRMILDFITVHRKEYPGYWRGFVLNGTQYIYSFLPLFIRRPLQNVLASLKRRAF